MAPVPCSSNQFIYHAFMEPWFIHLWGRHAVPLPCNKGKGSREPCDAYIDDLFLYQPIIFHLSYRPLCPPPFAPLFFPFPKSASSFLSVSPKKSLKSRQNSIRNSRAESHSLGAGKKGAKKEAAKIRGYKFRGRNSAGSPIVIS